MECAFCSFFLLYVFSFYVLGGGGEIRKPSPNKKKKKRITFLCGFSDIRALKRTLYHCDSISEISLHFIKNSVGVVASALFPITLHNNFFTRKSIHRKKK